MPKIYNVFITGMNMIYRYFIDHEYNNESRQDKHFSTKFKFSRKGGESILILRSCPVSELEIPVSEFSTCSSKSIPRVWESFTVSYMDRSFFRMARSSRSSLG
jgi:hypothetical protein